MTGLEDKAHRLLELARGGDDPSAAQLLSLHGGIAARIAAEGAITSTTTTTAKATSGGAFIKGLLVAGAVVTGAAGFFALSPAESPPTAVRPARLVTSAPAQPPPAPAPPGPAAHPTVPVEAAPSPAPPVRASRPPSALRLQDEAALLADVQGALRSGEAAAALTKLESYDRRFPSGMLRAEADAARVFALCAAGKVERARAVAARFAERYPSSPALARVQAACK